MASPLLVIRVLADCGSRMRDPYGAGPPVPARHHANTEGLRSIQRGSRDGFSYLPGGDPQTKQRLHH